MMWHWNSWWEPRQDNPTVAEPPAWHGPWGVEQVAAWQARSWEHMVSASRSMWSFWLGAMPVPTFPAIGQLTPPTPPQEVQPEPPAAAEARAPRKSPPRKRTAHPDGRHAQQARHR
jgi:hypothetical protein